MFIWAWIFGVPFVVAAIDLAMTGKSSTSSYRSGRPVGATV
jgi:hypothetical protein